MTPARLAEVMEATWPPAQAVRVGPWTVRNGAGGGKRVSATTANGAWSHDDLPLAEAAMAAQGQPALFAIRDGETELDAALAARGYRIVDPVVAYACAAASLAPPPVMTTFPHWPPLAITRDLWAEGGVGPARLAVMDRVAGPKAAILCRLVDRPCGVAFVALSGSIAMLHALEVNPGFRRQGSAHHILQAAAHWALDQGADTLSLAVTVANDPARALYASLRMQGVGQYHYRQK
jgi:GNAT superfamily N-acetyltransferase